MTGRTASHLMQLVSDFPEPHLAQAIRWLQQQKEPHCFLVGGTVRDHLLAATTHFAPARNASPLSPQRAYFDLDFAVPTGARQLARHMANALNAAYYPLDDTRDVGRVVMRSTTEDIQYIIDIAGFQGGDLETDLRARDFSINAMAVDIHSQPPRLLDPCGGLQDLKVGLLRSNSEAAIAQDPVRALRAVRFRAQFGFEIETHTRALIARSVLGLSTVSAERIRDEANKILQLAGAIESLYELDSLGILCVLFPELLEIKGIAPLGCHEWDVFSHSLETVGALEEMLPIDMKTEQWDIPYPTQIAQYLSHPVAGGTPRRTLLTWAALFHELGRAQTDEDGHRKTEHQQRDQHPRRSAEIAARVLERLRFSRSAIRIIETALRYHAVPLQITIAGDADRRTSHRFFRSAGEAGVESILLALADNRAKIVPGSHTEEWPALLRTATFLLDTYFNQRNTVIDPPPLLSGKDMVTRFQVKPGPEVGRLLRAIAEEQAAGEITNRLQAEDWMLQKLGETGTNKA
jgi:poly(A) polymerase